MSIFFAFLFFFIASFAESATPAPCTHWASPTGTGNGLSQGSPFQIHSFWAIAKPGNTLCLRDGTYTAVDANSSIIAPPSGVNGTSSLLPITIRAENDGQVWIDGGATLQPIYVGSNSYINVEGMNAYNSGYNVVGTGTGSHNVIFRRIIAWDSPGDANYHVWSIDYGTDNLVEDSAGFGLGRSILIDYTATRVTVRRFWAMYEGTNDPNQANTGPEKAIMLGYRSTQGTVENSIMTWQQRPGQPAFNGSRSLMQMGSQGTNHRWLGNIEYMRPQDANGSPAPMMALMGLTTETYNDFWNVPSGPAASSNPTTTIQDNVAYGGGGQKTLQLYKPGSAFSFLTRSTEVTTGTAGTFVGNWTVTNRLNLTSLSTLNTGTNNIWDGSGSNGARVCKQYVDGVLTNTPLWPWPMDARIRAALDFRYGAGKADAVFSGPTPGARNVTTTMENLFGNIPQACRSGGAVVLVNITSPTSNPTYPTPPQLYQSSTITTLAGTLQ